MTKSSINQANEKGVILRNAAHNASNIDLSLGAQHDSTSIKGEY